MRMIRTRLRCCSAFHKTHKFRCFGTSGVVILLPRMSGRDEACVERSAGYCHLCSETRVVIPPYCVVRGCLTWEGPRTDDS